MKRSRAAGAGSGASLSMPKISRSTAEGNHSRRFHQYFVAALKVARGTQSGATSSARSTMSPAHSAPSCALLA